MLTFKVAKASSFGVY